MTLIEKWNLTLVIKMKCGNCQTENDDGVIFCYQCGINMALVRGTVTSSNGEGKSASLVIVVAICFILVFPFYYATLTPSSNPIDQFTLKEWEMSADTDHLGIGFGYWIHVGAEMNAYVYNLNNTDAYLLRITEYTQRTQVLTTRDYNVSGVVNLTVQYTFSDFIYFVNEGGNVSFTLYRGDWMQYTDASGVYRVINRSSLVYMSACYILPAM